MLNQSKGRGRNVKLPQQTCFLFWFRWFSKDTTIKHINVLLVSGFRLAHRFNKPKQETAETPRNSDSKVFFFQNVGLTQIKCWDCFCSPCVRHIVVNVARSSAKT